MKISKIKEVLKKCLPHKHPVLLVGPPGHGKTECVQQLADAMEYKLYTVYPAMSDPVDIKGIPFLHSGMAVFRPIGIMQDVLNEKKDAILFFDDIGQATSAVQAALMPAILNRRIGDHMLPDNIICLAATNRRTDLAGVSGMLEPLKSRFLTILQVEFDLEEWKAWAIANDVDEYILAFANYKPNYFTDFKPSKDLKNSPSPRTIWHVNLLRKMGIEDYEAYAGAAGDAYASDFMAFCEMAKQIPEMESIIASPETVEIPRNVSILYGLCGMLAYRTVMDNYSRIAKFVDRLPIEFQIVFAKDLTTRNKKIVEHPEFKKRLSKYAGVIFGQGEKT